MPTEDSGAGRVSLPQARLSPEGHALRQEAYQREREALQALAEERERRHKAELLALEAQMQARLEALTRANETLSRDLDRATTLFGGYRGKDGSDNQVRHQNFGCLTES